MPENWLPVTGYEGLYEVSDLGRIRSLDRVDTMRRLHKGRVLKPGSAPGRYPHVGLSRCRTVVTRYVHHVVLEAFIGPCPEGMEACHNDGDLTNNRPSNLRWDGHTNNQADKCRHGTTNRGERCGTSKLTAIDIERTFDLHRNGCLQQDIASWMSITRSHVSRILSGKAWAHLHTNWMEGISSDQRI